MQRADDYPVRRRQIAHLSDEELYRLFWDLTNRVVEPLVELAKAHTSPSIERSVLLRMGFSSLEAKAIAEGSAERHLLGKGAGHVVLKVAQATGMDIRNAGRELAAGRLWDAAERAFTGTATVNTNASGSGDHGGDHGSRRLEVQP